MFKKVPANTNFAQIEETILDFWKREKIFEKTLESTKNNEKFIFYEGPPTANGAPGVHHVLSRIFKDIFPRFKTMKGFYVARKAGWDTHGLPVEIEVEKKLGINSKKEIEKIGVEKFNALCRESVMKYEDDWKKMTERIGFWIDMDNAYFTFKNEYIETVWWILKTIWDKSLLYEGHKIVPYCPRCGTALSSHEVAQGYKDIEDTTIIVKFALESEENTYLLVWTTTPWTLISNAACAVNRSSGYITAESGGDKFILNEDLVSEVFKDKEYKILKKFKGEELLEKKYIPLYDYSSGSENAFKIIHGDFVSTSEGTGIVHIAPAFGEDDMLVGRKNNLPVIQMVNDEGIFKSEVKKFANMPISEANTGIIRDIKERGFLFKQQKVMHSYPFCWRCDSRLIYYAKKSWYIRTSEIKELLINSNEDVSWYPEHIKEGRYGKWLENNQDWALTRERYWELNISDEKHGSWGQQGVEVSCKSWLSGGALKVNKKTWFAHMFRTQGGDFGFPYPNPGIGKAREYSRDLWINNKWDKALHPLSWLIEKFWPVDGWTEEDLINLKNGTFKVGEKVKDTKPVASEQVKSNVSKGIIFYTDNQLGIKIAHKVQHQLGKMKLPIVSASLKPMSFGSNVYLPLKRSYLTMFKQIYAAIEASETEVIFFCEHDVLYHPSHFDFTPAKEDVWYYNENVWKLNAENGHCIHYDCKQVSGIAVYRKTALAHYKKRLEILEEKVKTLNEQDFNRYIRAMGFEPGTHNRNERVDDSKSEAWNSLFPNVDIRHGKNLTSTRWRKDQFRSQRSCPNWQEAEEIPGWGKVKI